MNDTPSPPPAPAEETMRPIGLRMAKATPEDLADAVILNGILSDVFEDETLPRDPQGNFPEGDEEGWFDEDNHEHLLRFYRAARTVYRRSPGGMNRVIWGMDTLLNAANNLVDPDADHLAPHPDIAALSQKLGAARAALQQLKTGFDNELENGIWEGEAISEIILTALNVTA